MKITILGSGTSLGVPIIGCDCEACTSTDPRDKRLRTSVYIEHELAKIVIDIGPDFRQQLLRANVQEVNAIVLTHEHNDHVIGLDDVRPMNFKFNRNMPIYATAQVQGELKRRFPYISDEDPYPGAPQIELNTISKDKPFFINGLEIQPIETLHGKLPVLGFRIGDFTYLTDAKYFEPQELQKINGSKYLILSALHHKPHHSHLSLSDALALVESLDVEQVYLTHLSHRMGRTAIIEKQLPTHVRFAYDGLEIEL